MNRDAVPYPPCALLLMQRFPSKFPKWLMGSRAKVVECIPPLSKYHCRQQVKVNSKWFDMRPRQIDIHVYFRWSIVHFFSFLSKLPHRSHNSCFQHITFLKEAFHPVTYFDSKLLNEKSFRLSVHNERILLCLLNYWTMPFASLQNCFGNSMISCLTWIYKMWNFIIKRAIFCTNHWMCCDKKLITY